MKDISWPAPDDWDALMRDDAPWAGFVSVLPLSVAVSKIGGRCAYLAASFTMCGLYQAGQVFGRLLDAGVWAICPPLQLFGASGAIRKADLSRCLRPEGRYPIGQWLAVCDFVVVPYGVGDRLPDGVWWMVQDHIAAGRDVIFLKECADV